MYVGGRALEKTFVSPKRFQHLFGDGFLPQNILHGLFSLPPQIFFARPVPPPLKTFFHNKPNRAPECLHQLSLTPLRFAQSHTSHPQAINTGPPSTLCKIIEIDPSTLPHPAPTPTLAQDAHGAGNGVPPPEPQ